MSDETDWTEESEQAQQKLERKLAEKAERQAALRSAGRPGRDRPERPKRSTMPRAGGERTVTVSAAGERPAATPAPETPATPRAVAPRQYVAPSMNRIPPSLELTHLRAALSEATEVIEELTSVLRLLSEGAKAMAREAGGEVLIDNAGPAPTDSREPR